MYKIILFILHFLPVFTLSQIKNFENYFESGKAEFTKEFENHDYKQAVYNLEKAVELQPNNMEAHYYLGYVYSRLNSEDGGSIPNMKLSLVVKASEEFEIINKSTSKYEGEIIVLDPFSKLSSEWGSMAMSYLIKEKRDSAVWAFSEGKRRGGFSDFQLDFSRKILDLCSENSILFCTGDNIVFPLWYLKTVENYRPDVTVICQELLSVRWYSQYLMHQGDVSYKLEKDLYDDLVDNFAITPLVDKLVSIETPKGNFSWETKSSYEGYELISSTDFLLLDLLKTNKFRREVFFTIGMMVDNIVNLNSNLKNYVLVDKINYSHENELSIEEYKERLKFVSESLKYINYNSQDELEQVDNIRRVILIQVEDKIDTDLDRASKLMYYLDLYFNMKKYPPQSKTHEQYYEILKEQIKARSELLN